MFEKLQHGDHFRVTIVDKHMVFTKCVPDDDVGELSCFRGGQIPSGLKENQISEFILKSAAIVSAALKEIAGIEFQYVSMSSRSMEGLIVYVEYIFLKPPAP